jgi:hypothetical protein
MTIQNKFWKHLLRNNTTQNNNQFAELVDANCELLHLFGWTYQQMTWRMTLTICAPVLRSSATPLWLINLINVQNMQTLGQIQPTIKTSRPNDPPMTLSTFIMRLLVLHTASASLCYIICFEYKTETSPFFYTPLQWHPMTTYKNPDKQRVATH